MTAKSYYHKHPYMSEGFWFKEENQFWNSQSYSDKGKKICEEFVKELKKLKPKDIHGNLPGNVR